MLLLSFFLFLMVATTGYYISRRAPLAPWYSLALFFKIISGIGLGWLYMYHYEGGDTLNYFQDATLLAQYARQYPEDFLSMLFTSSYPDFSDQNLLFADQPRALLMVKFTTVFVLLSGNHYFPVAAWFSLLAFLGVWFLANRLLSYYPNQKPAVIIAFFCWPSSIFWSSGLLKESLTMASISLLTDICLPFLLQKKLTFRLEWLLLPLLLWVLWKLKYYYAGAFTAVAATTWMYHRLNDWFIFTKKIPVPVLWSILLIVPVLFASQLHPNLNPGHVLQAIVTNHNLTVQLSEAGDYIHFSSLEARPESFAYSFPKALFSGLFRPLFTDVQNGLQLLAAIEKMTLLLLCLLTVPVLWKKRAEKISASVWACFMYIIALASLLAFASPNYGSLIRYQSVFIPWLVYLCLAAINSHYRETDSPSRRTSPGVEASASQ